MNAETWRHDFAQLEGVRLHYVTQGEGPLLLLLHGFPEFWYSWRHQIPPLARHFQVVVPDLRGYNDSEKPPRVSDYAIDVLTGDVLGLIRHFGQDKATVIGHDWGGAVAWAFAATHGPMTERLVVLNCPHPGSMQRHLLTNPRQLMRSWYFFFFQLPGLPERAILKDPYAFARRAFLSNAVRRDAFSDEDVRRYAEAISKPGAATAALNYYRASFREAVRKGGRRFPRIQSPTLLLWGEGDKALGKELTYGLERYVTGPLQVRYVPDSGHWVQQEAPEEVNRHLLEYLTSPVPS